MGINVLGLMDLVNLGLALVAVTVALLYYRRSARNQIERSWPYFLAAAGFFAFAQIFDMLGVLRLIAIPGSHQIFQFGSALSLLLAFRLLYNAEKQQQQNLTTIRQMGALLGSITEVEILVERVLDILHQALGIEGCSIMLVDDERQELYFAAARGLGAEVEGMRRTRIPVKHPLLEQAVIDKQPFMFSDVPAPGMNSARHPLFLTVPLVANDRLVGLMNIHQRDLKSLRHDQRDLLATLAAEVAMAVESARLSQSASRADTLAALVQEMHHRLKNNLQMVADLLSLEMSRERSASARASLEASIVRLQSISAVHELLSRDHLELTDVCQLAERVVGTAVRSLVRPEQRIEVNVEGPGVLIPAKQATALALVMNELVNNALKHAFVGQVEGRLWVTVAADPSGVIQVSVEDDGVGLAPGFDLRRDSRLGLQIAQTLVHKDLKGTLTLYNGHGGTTATVRFKR